MSIRPMLEGDQEAVLAIYQEGIDTGHATFDETAPTWNAFDEGHLTKPRLVGVEGEHLTGWVVLCDVSSRCVYGGVAELSVYVSAAARGRGWGRRLLDALIAASEAEGIWTLQAGIFVENEASIALHEKAGFRRVGVREKLGFMRHGPLAGSWRDVLLMERRSGVVGVGGR